MCRKRVYIAGPIANGDLDTSRELVRANVQRATEAGLRLVKAGFAPLVPQLTVYLGGPVKGPTEEGLRLVKAEFAPLVPHLAVYLGGPVKGPTEEILPGETTFADWYGVDLSWVAVADALLRLPGASRGADLEVACAVAHGVPVFYHEADLLEAFCDDSI